MAYISNNNIIQKFILQPAECAVAMYSVYIPEDSTGSVGLCSGVGLGSVGTCKSCLIGTCAYIYIYRIKHGLLNMCHQKMQLC